MKVKFPMAGLVTEARINSEILPVGFVSQKASSKRFNVLRGSDKMLSGYCEVVDDGVLVNFYTVTDWGKLFMSAFGRHHPDLNPSQTLYGFVYKGEKADSYKMAMLPLKSRQEALPELKKYVASGSVFYVKFCRGDWEDDTLYVLEMRDIAIDGSLGENVGPKRLALGNVESVETK